MFNAGNKVNFICIRWDDNDLDDLCDIPADMGYPLVVQVHEHDDRWLHCLRCNHKKHDI